MCGVAVLKLLCNSVFCICTSVAINNNNYFAFKPRTSCCDAVDCIESEERNGIDELECPAQSRSFAALNLALFCVCTKYFLRANICIMSE